MTGPRITPASTNAPQHVVEDQAEWILVVPWQFVRLLLTCSDGTVLVDAAIRPFTTSS